MLTTASGDIWKHLEEEKRVLGKSWVPALLRHKMSEAGQGWLQTGMQGAEGSVGHSGRSQGTTGGPVHILQREGLFCLPFWHIRALCGISFENFCYKEL